MLLQQAAVTAGTYCTGDRLLLGVAVDEFGFGAVTEARTALVTGAGSGIGAACAELFLARGHNVVAVDLRAGQDGGTSPRTALHR